MKTKMNAYEKSIMRSFENGEWKSVKNVASENKRYESYARNMIKFQPKRSSKTTAGESR